MKAQLKDILTGLIIGDAAGRPLDGLSREHIKSCFKNISGYVDAGPALKHHQDKWKKPGLYSSISQFAIINFLSFTRGRLDEKKFIRFCDKAAHLHFSDTGLFRDTDRIESQFLNELSNPGFRPGPVPSVRVIPSAIPLSVFFNNPHDLAVNTIKHIMRFTTHCATAAGSALLNLAIRQLCDYPETEIMTASFTAASTLKQTAESSPSAIFDLGLNPAQFIESVQQYSYIFEQIGSIDNTAESEQIICTSFNKIHSENQIKRATLDNPLALLTFVLHFLSINADKHDTESAISSLTCLGGRSSTMGAIAGALTAAFSGINTESILVSSLLNKGRILKLSEEGLSVKEVDSIFDDFIANEKLMTAKEETEKLAKLKHGKNAQKKTLNDKPEKKSIVEKINRHVVESWTKDDRARWKKSGQKTIKS